MVQTPSYDIFIPLQVYNAKSVNSLLLSALVKWLIYASWLYQISHDV